MLKRILILLFIVLVMSGCSKDSREVVTFSSWGSVTEVEILNNVISNFEKQNPDIKINFMHIPQNYFQKIHLLFASNTEPDVIFVNNLYLPVYKNELDDLTEIVNTEEFFDKGIRAFSIDGKLLAVPRDISNFVLFYNKKYVPQTPRNFSDFDVLIKNVSSPSHFGISYERDIFYAEPYMLTLGEKEGLEYYLNMEGKYAPKPSDVGSSTQAQMFLDGKIVFYLTGRWMYPKIKESAKFKYGIMNFPGYVYADASGWAISRKSKHKDSAKKFVRYLASKDSIDYFTETGLIVPARKDSAKKLNDEYGKIFVEAIEKSKIRKIDRDYKRNRDKINKEIFR